MIDLPVRVLVRKLRQVRKEHAPSRQPRSRPECRSILLGCGGILTCSIQAAALVPIRPGLPCSALPIPHIIRRSFLDDQAVSRDMLRPQHQHLPQGRLPGMEILPRQGGHQIHIDIGKARLPGPLIAFQKVIVGMRPPQARQLLIVGGLEPQAQPVHAAFQIGFQLFHGQGPRVRLDGDLRILRHIKAGVHRRKKLLDQLSRQNGRSTASHKDRGHAVLLKMLPLSMDFFDQLLHIRPVLPLRRGKRQKVAVGAFAQAERDMQIQFQIQLIHHLISARS